MIKKKEKPKKTNLKNKSDEKLINENIKAKKVRVVGEGIESDIYDIKDAIELARSMSADLVEIVPNTNPPVCKIIEYSKFKYEQKKQKDKIKSNTKEKIVKEIKLGANISIGDFNTKLSQARKFLEEKKSAKVSMAFYGKLMKYKESGSILLNKFIDSLLDIGEKEFELKTDGKKVYTVVNPVNKKKT